jgi:hypothetical protein
VDDIPVFHRDAFFNQGAANRRAVRRAVVLDVEASIKVDQFSVMAADRNILKVDVGVVRAAHGKFPRRNGRGLPAVQIAELEDDHRIKLRSGKNLPSAKPRWGGGRELFTNFV